MELLEPFAIEFSGVNLVEASAGTGKTYNITSLYIRALIEQDISVGKILVVTYTEAATKELKDRLLKRIRDSIEVLKSGKMDKESDDFLEKLLDEVDHPPKAVEKLEKAVRMFDEASVYTIHGFCYQALQEQAFESGAMYDAEMIGDDSEIVQEAVDDYWRQWVAEVSEHPKKQPLLKLFIDNNVGPDTLAHELGSYIGKPYLQVLPEKTESYQIEEQLEELWEIYEQLQSEWNDQRKEIFDLLNSGDLSYYTESALNKWFGLMDGFLESDVPPFETFTQFYRFQQSKIDKSLKKKPREQGKKSPQHIFFKLIDEYKEIKESVKDFEVIFKKELLTYLRGELSQKKEELQVLSYDDLLLHLRNALLDQRKGQQLAAKLRQKYPIAMVDEFQDTDPNQYDIFRTVYKDSDRVLFMIGDPKQSIYSFRGADVYSYIKARKDAPVEKRYLLDRNFRSTPDLLKGLNAFWGGQDIPFVVDDIKYQKVTWGWPEQKYNALIEYGTKRPPIRFRRLSEPGQDSLNKREARGNATRDTAKEIQRLLEDGKKNKIILGDRPVKAKDIAVLVRKHKQADLIAEALGELDIKSVQHSEKSVFESDEAGQLEQLLKAVADPANETRIKTALSLPLTRYSADELFSIEEDDKHWTIVLQQFSDWHRMWQDQGFSAMFRSLLDELNIADHVIKYSNGERRLTNLLHLGELLQEESQDNREGTRSLLHWLARKRQDNSNNKREEEQMRLESDEELVKIVTMHKSKGLQYPIVFCPFLWHGPHIQDKGQPLVYHHPENNEVSYLDLSGKSDPDRPQKRFYDHREELAESLRLAYVAMTRAEHCLYLTWEFAKASEFSSLGYLLQDPGQPEALLREKVGFDESVDWSGDAMHEAIEDICDEYPNLFTLKREPKQSKNNQLEFPGITDEKPEYHIRSFERTTPLRTSYQVSSFSSLSSWMEEEDPNVPDYDQFMDYEELDERTIQKAEKQTIFTFPKGPQPGTCIHNIFENYFSKDGDKDEVILNQLQLNGINESWKSTVSRMLDLVLQKSLHPDRKGLSLSTIKDRQIPEMEFYYQNNHIETQRLLSIIRNGAIPEWGNRGEAESGFLKGFIDLTFEFNGKYYLLDYKTNYLGDSISDYQLEELKHEMREASYDLQYHIYTVALHRFLNKQLPNYSYENHFGGAFYLFVRGINEKGREGIFFDCPDEKIIKELDEYIKGQLNG
ncbi:exodeoxyribonuclease V subunit beta [Aliifodinibius salicampi]|uniref:DNA 3'-5' helicase n=1 Tax=Fodinibius salicampi TaxID=1920655 RepID=A0ABT3PW92_9BACT|nr:exodeoxyribonuclease V subunit beta [Fodinibius salicampi]MCW9712117.1 exodeoxyribonuclease V subunit beta [Fodinibius salicampi]